MECAEGCAKTPPTVHHDHQWIDQANTTGQKEKLTAQNSRVRSVEFPPISREINVKSTLT
jgi:hypothetical protein